MKIVRNLAAAAVFLSLPASSAAASLNCTVTFRLQSAVVLGGLQWRTSYSAAPGYFSGDGPAVQCGGLVSGGIAAFNDDDGALQLMGAVVTANSFSGPTNIAACTFVATSTPLAANFHITVEEAYDPSNAPLFPLPIIGIQSINCAGTAVCGNGTVESNEGCDDGNAINTDACLSNCTVASCGDGHVRAGVEQCDDGNASNADACVAGCVPARCGDGFVRPGFEECDDSNQSSTDSCTAVCKPAVCGDGFRRSGFEECDDANTADGDGCSSSCESQRLCGDATDDGFVYASDAFRILKRGVGNDVECPTWICDVDGSGTVTATDALRVLRRSVDIPVPMDCGLPTKALIQITTTANLGALQFNVNYSSAKAEFDGSGSGVQCVATQADVEAAFNDKPERTLSASFVTLTGLHGPAVIARCELTPTGEVKTESFPVAVLDAKDLNGSTVTKPAVRVVPD